MPVLRPDEPLATEEPVLVVENALKPGAYRFRLVVVNAAGVASDPALLEVVVRERRVPPVAGPGAPAKRPARTPATKQAPPKAPTKTATKAAAKRVAKKTAAKKTATKQSTAERAPARRRTPKPRGPDA